MNVYPRETLQGHFDRFEDTLLQHFKQKRHFSSGETIIGMTDDRSKFCFYILSGSVIVLYIDNKGVIHTSSIRSKGTIFPLYYTFRSTTIESTLTFSALTDCEILILPKDKVKELLSADHDFMLAMMDAWGDYATYLNYRTEMYNESIEERVCSYLWLSNIAESEVIHATHQEIANAVGSTRETVTRVLNKLKRQGIIDTGRKKIKIISLEKLEAKITSDSAWGTLM